MEGSSSSELLHRLYSVVDNKEVLVLIISHPLVEKLILALRTESWDLGQVQEIIFEFVKDKSKD